MLRIFRTNQLLFGVVLVFYAALLHSAAFVAPSEPVAGKFGVLGYFIEQWVAGGSYFWFALATVLLLFAQAFALNFLVAEHRLLSTTNLFPGVFFLMISSAVPAFLPLTPLHIANICLLIALWQLMSIYKAATCADRIFNIGFWIGIASLFYLSYSVFIILAIVGINIMRAFDIRERLMAIIGFVIPYLLLAVYFYWNDDFGWFVEKQFIASLGFLSFRSAEIWEAYTAVGIFAILIIISLMSANSYLFKTQIQVQKKINILFWTLLIAALSLLLQNNIGIEHLLIFATPLSVFIAINFSKLKPQIAETLHTILLVAILFYQYKDLIFAR